MKKIFITLLFAALFVSCYQDKGNYDYTLSDMNEITDVIFTPAIADGNLIELQQALNEEDRDCKITVDIKQTKSENYDNLDFYWKISGTNIKDTVVETRGFLDIKLPLAQDLKYSVLLQIYDRTTTLSYYRSFKVETRPIFKNSLFVLHGKEGERKLGNIEIIEKDTMIYSDAYAKLFGEESNPFINSEALCYSTFHDNSNGINKNQHAHFMTVFDSDGKASVYDPYGLKFTYSNTATFRPASESFTFARNIQVGSVYYSNFFRTVISKEGQFYIGNHFPILYKPGHNIEIGETQNNAHVRDYRVTAASITPTRVVLWDAKYNCFLYLVHNEWLPQYKDQVVSNFYLSNPVQDANVDFSTLEKSPEGLKAVYSYIQYVENYNSDSKPYFIFHDETNNEFWRYELESQAIGEGKDNKANMTRANGEPDAAFTIKGQRLENFEPGEQLNTIVYNSYFTTNYLFYANGGTVYRYNISNGDNTVMYKAPEGYTVSVIKFRNEDSSDFMDNLGLFMSIGLNNGDNGAVAEILLQTSSDVDETFPTLFYEKDKEGNYLFGNIKDLQFTPFFQYKIPDHLK